MNVFLPYPSIIKSVRALDYRRLGKQRVECLQILNVLQGKTKGWGNHPATRMWRGYESALIAYMNACIEEWVRRGYKNTMPLRKIRKPIEYPPWFGDRKLHRAYQSNLLRKDKDYYGSMFPGVPDDLPYVWPVSG